ncbi:MAG: hypothetical protein GC164_12960 [Phycisphaera sp.]|nr:hypothetical protein [Phycisphaera sp.]
MAKRLIPLCRVSWIIVVVVFITAAQASAQSHPTAEQLLQQGVKQVEAGDVEAGRTTLMRVDALQLDKDQRVALYEALRKADEQIKAKTDPAKLLAQADADLKAGQLNNALKTYESVAAHPGATADQRKQADDGKAQAQTQLDALKTKTQATIDAASADMQAGRLDAAQAKLQSVKASSQNLGWFDNERVDRMLALIAEQRQLTPGSAGSSTTPAVATTAPATPEPEKTVPDDLATALDAPTASTEPTPEAPSAPEPATPEVQPIQVAQAEPVAPVAPAQPEPAPTPTTTEPEPEPAAPVAETPKTTKTAKTDKADKGGDDLMNRLRLLEAQRHIAQAQQAEDQGQWRLAVELYQQALALDPENAAAKNGLATAQMQVEARNAPLDVLQQNRENITIQRQAVLAQYDELIGRAGQQKAEGNYEAAVESVQQARLLLDRNQNLLPVSEYETKRQSATDLAASIADARRKDDEARKVAAEAQLLEDAARRRQDASRAREQEVQNLLVRASALQREQKYTEALDVIEQALFIDPGNIAAQTIKRILEDNSRYIRQRELVRNQQLKAADLSLDNLEAATPYVELMTYPSDWPQITERRLGSTDDTGGESEINRRVALKLRDPIQIDFKETSLVAVFEFLRNFTGVNIFVNWPALQAIGVEQDTRISLKLNNVPTEQALRLILTQAAAAGGLGERVAFSIIDGIVTISTQTDLTKTTETRPYDIRDLLVQVPSFTEAPAFDLNSALSNTSSGGSNTGGGGGGGGNTTSLFGDQDQEQTEKGPTRAELVQQITDLIQETIGEQTEWAAFGGTVSSLRELNGNLIVKSTPENHRAILKLLAQLRETRAMQIAVEARFLLVEQNFLDELGVDLDVQFNNLGSSFGPLKIAQDSIGLAQARGSSVPGSFNSTSTIGPIGNFVGGAGIAGTNRSFDVGFSYLDDVQVNLLINATQAKRRSISVTAPRITFFNGQRAYVIVARQIAFISDLEPVPNSLGFNPTLSITQSGVTLDVEGTISSDRRYVTLTVRPSLATLASNPPRRIEQSATVNANVLGNNNNNNNSNNGAISFSAYIEAPELELTSLRATVSVPDKGTLLMGGQRITADVEVEAGVPVLSKIPIINRFFTNSTKVKDERSVLILVKPTIIIQSELEEENFPGLNDNPTAYNAGLNSK